jgi:hypothetical protein
MRSDGPEQLTDIDVRVIAQVISAHIADKQRRYNSQWTARTSPGMYSSPTDIPVPTADPAIIRRTQLRP